MLRLTSILVAGIIAATLSSPARADDPKNEAIAKEAARYIVAENRKHRRDPRADMGLVAEICGSRWHKGCDWTRLRSGKDKYRFQKKSGGVIYGIPSYLLKKRK